MFVFFMNVGEGSFFILLCCFSRLMVTLKSFFSGSFLKGFDQKIMLFPRLDTVKKEVSARCFC